MKKIFINKFKSIYNEIVVDIETENLISLVGKNGSGKTNILEAINWFFNKSPEDQNVVTSFLNQKKKGLFATVTYIETINERKIKAIKEVFKKNLNIEDISFSFNIDEYYNIHTKRSDVVNKINLDDFKSNDGYLFKSVFPLIANDFISMYIEDVKLNNKIEININEMFDKNKNNYYYKVNFNIVKEIREKISLRNSNYRSWVKKMDVINKISEALLEIKSILDVSVHNKVFYIKNADNENDIKTSYSLSDLTKPDNSTSIKIDRFLNSFFDFKGYINELSNYQEMLVDEIGDITLSNEGTEIEEVSIQSDTYSYIMDTIDRLNQECNEKIKELFKNFDLYCYPKFQFDRNRLEISITDKNDFVVGNKQTKFNSSGYKAFLFLFMKLMAVNLKDETSDTNYIFLADEPDKNLHAVLQIQFLDFIVNRTNSNVKIILTTHSPYMISIKKSKIYVISKNPLKNEKESGTTYIECDYKNLESLKNVDIISLFPIIKSVDFFAIENRDNTVMSLLQGVASHQKMLFIKDSVYENVIENKKTFNKLIYEYGYKLEIITPDKLETLKNDEICCCKNTDFKSWNSNNNTDIFGEFDSKISNMFLKILIVE